MLLRYEAVQNFTACFAGGLRDLGKSIKRCREHTMSDFLPTLLGWERWSPTSSFFHVVLLVPNS